MDFGIWNSGYVLYKSRRVIAAFLLRQGGVLQAFSFGNLGEPGKRCGI